MDFHFSAIFAPWDKCKFASRFIIAAVNENHAVSDSFFEKFSVISVFCASLVPELARKYGSGTKVKSIASSSETSLLCPAQKLPRK